MPLENIWVLDEAKLGPIFLDAYNEGKAVIHDGVAYWAKNSGKTGVIQHLPFKEAAFNNMGEAIKAAQMTTVVAASVSTAIVLGAIVVQTQYLAGKLNKIQETVDLISQDVHAQNILFYMDKVTEYFGHVETARSWLKNRDIANEIKDVAAPLLFALAAKRNQLLSLTINVLSLAENNDTSSRHFKLILDFAQMILDTLPMGIHVEYLTCARIGKIGLAEQTLLDGAERYEMVVDNYRDFLNGIHQNLVLGKLSAERRTVFQEIEQNAKKMLGSETNKILLSLQTGRADNIALAA